MSIQNDCFEKEIIMELEHELRTVRTFKDYSDIQNEIEKLQEWLQRTPENTTFRVNLNETTLGNVIRSIEDELTRNLGSRGMPSIKKIEPDVVVVDRFNDSVELNLELLPHEVIVDTTCGLAILRGAHVFAPGILGMPHGLQIGDKVSVFADISGSCRKGSIKRFEGKKRFVGNGKVLQNRHRLFAPDFQNHRSGIAIFMTDVVSRLPQINEQSFPEANWVILQNLPSIVCSRILDPRAGELVLDMCAAPGNKTTHISNLMRGKGTVIALEKRPNKIGRLKKNCEDFSSGNVQVYCFDSTKAVSSSNHEDCEVLSSPPFPRESFDRILLDGPCSALGQRPQLFNPISLRQLQSYPKLQKQLFSAAVDLLKPGGTLVYSTCTVTISENESIVSWALEKFPLLKIVPVDAKIHSHLRDSIGVSSGYRVEGLDEEDSQKLYRFGPGTDSVGFFIAKFVKDRDSRGIDD